jgi:hypothetical protein
MAIWLVWFSCMKQPRRHRAFRRLCLARLVGSLFFVTLDCNAQGVSNARVILSTPYAGKVGEPFQIELSLDPPNAKPVEVTFEPREGIVYPKARIIVGPGAHQFVAAKPTTLGTDGMPWIHATASGYDAGWEAINLGFLGHLKPSGVDKLPYAEPTSLTFSLVDQEGRAFRSDKELSLLVESTDAALQMHDQTGSLKLKLLRFANVSPQFQVTSKNLEGGAIHINTTLMYSEDYSLDSQSFSIPSEPAWWVPIALAIGGGLLYGIYKALDFKNLPAQNVTWTIVGLITTSGLSGVLGYLIADLDLLGLKLDPNVLRTYPLIGFLVAYIGMDTLVTDKLGIKRTG